MSSAESILAARVVTQLRLAAVATQAGVAALTWAATDFPRVFRGLGGFLGGRNRGRLPFIEYEIQGQGFVRESIQGGELTQTVRLRVHVGGGSLETASELCAAILGAGIAAIRSESVDYLTGWGDEAIERMVPGPWGHQRDASLTVVQTYSRSDFGVL